MTTRSDSDVRQDAGELSTRDASPQTVPPEAASSKTETAPPVPPSTHHPFAVQVSTWLLQYPRLRIAVYALASLIIGMTQGLGINLVSSNLPGIQGSLGISNVESYWLVAAYTATSVTGTILLYKIRTQFGFRRFGEYGLLFFAVASMAQTFTHDFQTALAVRAVMGFAMASLGPLALFYMFEIFPPAKKLTAGLCFGLAGSQIALPVSRIISPHLLDLGHWHQLTTLESGLSLICLAIIWILPLTHPPRVKVFERTDWISYPLIATAVACMSVVLTMGRYYWWQEKDWIGEVLVVESTDNAYVRGNVTLLSPQVSGYITDVKVQDFMPVKKGDLLFVIDDSTYRQEFLQAQAAAAQAQVTLQNFEQNRASGAASLQLAEAELQSAQATQSKATLDTGRNGPLLEKGLVSKTTGDELHAALLTAQANVAKARASVNIARQSLALVDANKASLAAAFKAAQARVEVAQINLQHTQIVAPSDGQLGEVSARLGQYVSAGTQLTSVTPKMVWVTANFKERQLAGMAVGTPASFTVDALNDHAFKGHVVRIAPAAGSEFSVLKTDNATGNFTKISQRIAVRIELEPGQLQSDQLRPGMSTVVSVDTSQAPES